jgi:hypothetical protein
MFTVTGLFAEPHRKVWAVRSKGSVANPGLTAEQPRAQHESQQANDLSWLAGRSRPGAFSWHLRIMCMSSMPARVTAADQKDLNPIFGRSWTLDRSRVLFNAERVTNTSRGRAYGARPRPQAARVNAS